MIEQTTAGRLADKVAVVTGAARGIGEATARRFVAEGARVVIADLRDDAGSALAAELGEHAEFEHLDVTDERGWSELVERTLSRWGRVDVLVNNAGIGAGGPLESFDLDDHHRVLDVNVNGTFLGVRAVTEAMRRQGAGAIVNISSIDGLVGIAGLSSYVTSKFAVTGLTRAAALELGPAGIRVNSVHPGVIDTPLLSEEGRRRVAQVVSMQPLARLGRPEEVAALVLFLAGDEAGFITGGQYVIDGGHLAGPWRPFPAR
jgi:3alpha(or 20beta)-hydroxysteroid dehydrogenase